MNNSLEKQSNPLTLTGRIGGGRVIEPGYDQDRYRFTGGATAFAARTTPYAQPIVRVGDQSRYLAGKKRNLVSNSDSACWRPVPISCKKKRNLVSIETRPDIY